MVNTQALPYAVTENESTVKNGDSCLRSRDQLTVYVNEDRFVTRIWRVCMSAICHLTFLLGRELYSLDGEKTKPITVLSAYEIQNITLHPVLVS